MTNSELLDTLAHHVAEMDKGIEGCKRNHIPVAFTDQVLRDVTEAVVLLLKEVVVGDRP